MTSTHCSFHEYSITCAHAYEIEAVTKALSATWQGSKDIAKLAGVTTARATTILSLLIGTRAAQCKRDTSAKWARQVYRRAL